MKKILVLTTKRGGHRSSSDAIKTALLALDSKIIIDDIDSNNFFLGYKGLEKQENHYTNLTTRFRFFWKIFFEFTSFFKCFSNYILYTAIIKRFKKYVFTNKPDAILTVHPCFVSSIRLCLKKIKLDIPIYTCIIDLVKHSRLWHDKKSALTFVPTAQMRQILTKKGFDPNKVIHSGFPIGDKFSSINKAPRTNISTPNVLMVNPSLKGNRAVYKLVLATLKNNVNLTIVTGINAKQKQYLDKRLSGHANVSVVGYISNMGQVLSQTDVLIAKAGPNMILEAAKMCVPVLVTDKILGQEEKNYQYVEQNKYGFRCSGPKALDLALKQLFKDDFALLKEFSKNAQNCGDIDGAKSVAKHLLEHFNNNNDSDKN